MVHVFRTVQRSAPVVPALVQTMTVGPLPDMVLPNHDCSMLAVANEGEGVYDPVSGLIDPEGSITVIKLGSSGNAISPVLWTAGLTRSGSSTDAQLIAKGVHLPLPRNALEYWDKHSSISSSINFTAAISSYTPSTNLEPEYLAWSGDGTKLYVNLQENNAIATFNVHTNSAPTLAKLDGLGLVDWSTAGGNQGIDIKKDQQCIWQHYANFASLRMPDSIQAVNIDGRDYILTADEGDDKSYGGYDEKFKLKDLIQSGVVQIQGATASPSAVSTANAIAAVETKMRVTLGSTAVDYSNPAAPKIDRIVAFGGRGISVFEDQGSQLAFVWGSGSQLEKQQCATYPWAHNGIQDEEFAAVNGVLYNHASSKLRDTITEMNDPSKDGCANGGNGQPGACPIGQTKDERSAKDGPAAEAIVAGVACGRLLAVTASEKQSIAFVYDISQITAPQLLFVKALSPASETKNPGLAYAARELGEIDPESMVFVDAAHSPSGKPGVLFAGAWSGTVSFWEFTCPTTTQPAASAASKQTIGVINLLFRSVLAAVLILGLAESQSL